MRQLGGAAALAIALALGLLPALGPGPVAAARPDLTLVGHATYEVLPDEGRVGVSVRLRATNHLRDTVTRRFFFRTAFLTVLPGTSNFRISGGSGEPTVSVSKDTASYTNLRLDLGANLAAGRSTTLTLQFDLLDPGGAPDRPVRISPSVVTFDAWAFATPDTPGATVTVSVPADYRVVIGRGPLTGPTVSETGRHEWSSGPLDAPLDFVADVDADRLVEPIETSREVVLANGPVTILVRSWPDDEAWRDRVLGLIERALPVLEGEIGLSWPVEGPLVVDEALVRGAGYAGLFDPAERRIEVSYAAPDLIVLHELAHAWFNGRLVADRWVAEAFASYYADVAATSLGVEPSPPWPPVQPGSAVTPLNAWGPSEDETPETETYAYAAALELARSVAGRIGPEGLRRAWLLAASGVAAYPSDPSGDDVDRFADAEPASGPPDWRALLDLLEDEAGQDMDVLWRTWVARPEDLDDLDARSRAREAYAQTLAAAGEWRLPPSIREALRAWRFDAAVELLAAADGVLVQRDRLEASAAAAGLTLPDRLRRAFEGPDGPPAAAVEAQAEQTIVDAVVAAEAARPPASGLGDELVIGIGLLAADPETLLALARTALAAGDIETAYVAAVGAAEAWHNAASSGRSRIVSTALLTVALVLLFGLVRQARRRRAARAT